MHSLDFISRLYAYDDWANRETLVSLREAATGAGDRAVRFFAHVVACEELWLARLEASGEAVVVWPDWPLEETAGRLVELPSRWHRFMDSIGDGWARPVGYVNSKGEQFTSTVSDILTHVALHGAYHRGQIASALRESGEVPAITDYVHCTRLGLLD
jgi:uncharacterized damage-inducible protein DinB